MSVTSHAYTEQDVEDFFDQTAQTYLSFWDSEGVLHTGYFADEADSDVELDAVLESLLHMHHNRAVSVDPDHERVCRRLARQTAVAWHARLPGDSR